MRRLPRIPESLAATRAQLRAGGRLGWLRGAIGALIGIAVAGVAARIFGAAGVPWLVAPIGASAVLVFALPASPLAQPWPVFGGDVLSAAVGLLAGALIDPPWLAAGVGAGGAIAVMSMARCLHPPGGACALLCALGAGSEGWGASFLLFPLAFNVAALLAAGWLYNNLTGHAWPHRPAPAPVTPVVPATALPPGAWAGSYERADLDAVLEEWDEVLDVSRRDLDALFRAVERRVQRRLEQRRND